MPNPSKIPNPTEPPRRGRPPVDGASMTESVHVRCSAEQLARWEAEAAAQPVPVPVSAWIRYCADTIASGR